MTVDEKMTGDLITLTIHGRVETLNSDEFQNVILKTFQKSKNIILNMNDVPYISSAGLRALLIGTKTATSKGGKLIITDCSPGVKEVFRVTGFDGIFNIQ